MKTLFLITSLFFMSLTTIAQNKNARAVIEVDGVCGMCKERIEKAAIKTKGVKSAVWSIETHMLSLIYDENKTSMPVIEQEIANVGHDTENVKASKEAYENLHPCCKYKDAEIISDHKKNK